MAVEIIEGRVAPTEPKGSSRGFCLFDPLTITEASGKGRELRKVSAGGAVADAIRRGAEGRFYLGKNIGMAGIHGLRLKDGTAHYARYHNMELVLTVGAVAGLAMLLIGLVAPESFMITPVLIGAVLLVALIIVRRGRIADHQAFVSDRADG